MRRAVCQPDIGLDFDDPADSFAGGIPADQPGPENLSRYRQSFTRDESSVRVVRGSERRWSARSRLAQGNIETRSLGSSAEST
jgi:hypothetical protein